MSLGKVAPSRVTFVPGRSQLSSFFQLRSSPSKLMIRRFKVASAFISFFLTLAPAAFAQSAAKPAAKDETGFTSYASFEGTSDGDGQVYELNSSIGYSFTRHFGVDLGVPFYFVRPSSSLGTSSSDGIGNPSLDLRFRFPGRVVNFASIVTGSAPVGDSKKGLSTGRGTYDWTNHFDHAFDRFTPFGEVGISNTVADTRLFHRPFTVLGFNTPGTSSGHGRAFENSQQTTGSAALARDYGFSACIDANPRPYLDLELGYTRSVNYDLNAVSFGVGVNVGYLARRRNGY